MIQYRLQSYLDLIFLSLLDHLENKSYSQYMVQAHLMHCGKDCSKVNTLVYMSIEVNTVPDPYNTAMVSRCVAEFVACLVFDSVLLMNGA